MPNDSKVRKFYIKVEFYLDSGVTMEYLMNMADDATFADIDTKEFAGTFNKVDSYWYGQAGSGFYVNMNKVCCVKVYVMNEYGVVVTR